MRAGGEYFLEPAEAVQRRYEALRCYFVEDASAESVGARFGYSPATVHQLAAELRAGRSSFFRSSKPGPKGSRKTHTIRDRVLVLRAADRSVTEIAQALTAQGDAVSAQTVWAILKSEGLERLERRGPAGPASRPEPVTAKALGAWPTGARYDCDHAGLYLLLPAMVELGLDQLIGAANYPGTKVPTSPKPNKPAKSSPSPSTGSASPAPIPGCWSSTPNSPPTPCSTSSPPAASPSSPCANAAPKSSKPWPRYPPQPGGPTTSNAPAVTGTPRSTRRSCTSKASKRRYVRSRSATSATTSPPC